MQPLDTRCYWRAGAAAARGCAAALHDRTAGGEADGARLACAGDSEQGIPAVAGNEISRCAKTFQWGSYWRNNLA